MGADVAPPRVELPPFPFFLGRLLFDLLGIMGLDQWHFHRSTTQHWSARDSELAWPKG